jgi:hypothetical protein
MGRLFDAGEEDKKVADQRARNEDARARAAAVEEALRETDQLDEASKRLGAQLADAQAVQPIVYQTYRKPGMKWLIEHAQVGEDYVFQLFPLKPPKLNWKDIITMMIGAMDVVFPRTIKITYKPPNEGFQVKFYTIRAEKVVGVPGWESAVGERALRGLASIDAWPT